MIFEFVTFTISLSLKSGISLSLPMCHVIISRNPGVTKILPCNLKVSPEASKTTATLSYVASELIQPKNERAIN